MGLLNERVVVFIFKNYMPLIKFYKNESLQMILKRIVTI